jgi:hypothetical protein
MLICGLGRTTPDIPSYGLLLLLPLIVVDAAYVYVAESGEAGGGELDGEEEKDTSRSGSYSSKRGGEWWNVAEAHTFIQLSSR